MRAKIKQQVDVTQPINLRFLKPKDKILVAFKKEWMNTRWYKISKARSEQALHRELVQREDAVKEAILSTIYRDLIFNKTLEEKDLKAKEIIISVDSKYADVLFDRHDSKGNLLRKGVLSHNEFTPYVIEQVEENADIRRAFSSMPYLFRCSRRVIM